ncbi:MAG: hypothetical protein Fur0043_07620 [Anaerolineales bacterium]
MSVYDFQQVQKTQAPREPQEDLFANFKVQWKLNAVIFVMLLGLIGIVLTAFRGFAATRAQQNKNYESVLLPQIKISQADTALADLQTAIYALQNKNLLSAERQIHLQTIATAEERLKPIIEAYAANWLAPVPLTFTAGIRQTQQVEIEQKIKRLQDQEIANFTQFTEQYNHYLAARETMQAALASGQIDTQASQEALQSLSLARTAIENLIQINDQTLNILNEMVQLAYQDVIWRIGISTILAMSFGYLISTSIARSISHRLTTVENIARDMEDGYLDRRAVTSLGGQDEIAALSRTLSKMYKQLQETLASLEERVKERTRDLDLANQQSQRRAKQFEAIALVSNAISSIRSLDQLLPQIAEVISREFGYYHIGIFLLDDRKEYAILSAANSEGGQRMLARGHRLKVGEQGIVGYATATGQPRIALDVGKDAVFFNNPDLPETRSEMALPLKIGNTVVGALDVQSTEAAAFSEEDVNTLSLLTNQVSLAIENARLFDQARKSLDEAETVYRQYIRQAWRRLPQEQKLAGIFYSADGIRQIDTPSDWQRIYQEKSKRAADGQIYIHTVPLEIRGEKIGDLNVQIPSGQALTAEQEDLIKAVAERVAIAAENARLFDETTRRAERERLVSDITTKIRSTNDPERMIEVALEELKAALGATQIQLLPHVLPKTEAE